MYRRPLGSCRGRQREQSKGAGLLIASLVFCVLLLGLLFLWSAHCVVRASALFQLVLVAAACFGASYATSLLRSCLLCWPSAHLCVVFLSCIAEESAPHGYVAAARPVAHQCDAWCAEAEELQRAPSPDCVARPRKQTAPRTPACARLGERKCRLWVSPVSINVRASRIRMVI